MRITRDDWTREERTGRELLLEWLAEHSAADVREASGGAIERTTIRIYAGHRSRFGAVHELAAVDVTGLPLIALRHLDEPIGALVRRERAATGEAAA